MTKDKQQIQDLIDAGNKATDGNWNHEGKVVFVHDHDFTWEKDLFEFWTDDFENDCQFIIESANARPALKRQQEYIERLEAAVRDLGEELKQESKYLKSVAALIVERNGADSVLADQIATPFQIKAVGLDKTLTTHADIIEEVKNNG